MLTIHISNEMLLFKNIDEEMVKILTIYGVQKGLRDYYVIKGAPEKLYKVLVALSFDYDIEIV